MKKIIWIIIVLVAIVAIVLATFRTEKVMVDTNEPIKIGAVLSITGAASTWGDMSKKGIDLAVKEINDSGGIKNRFVKIVYEDAQTNPAKDVSAFNKLVSVDKVGIIFGDLWSFMTNPMIPLADEQKVTLISPTVMDVSVERQSPYFFTIGHTVASQRAAIEKFFDINKDIKTMAVLYWNDMWGVSNKDFVIDIATKKGVKIVSNEGTSDFGGTYQSEITKIKALNPDAIYLNTSLPDVALRKIKDLGLSKIKILTTSLAIDAIEVNKTPVYYLQNVYFTNWVPNNSFISNFKKEYGVYPIIEAQNSYVMVKSVAEALQKEGNFNENLRTVKFMGEEGYPIDFTRGDQIRVNEGQAGLYTYDGEYHQVK